MDASLNAFLIKLNQIKSVCFLGFFFLPSDKNVTEFRMNIIRLIHGELRIIDIFGCL